jgi:mRNA-degrading endonuclease toxin of MazEF toxin-antitoxin module
MGLSVSRLQTRLQKLERRSLAHTLAAQPEGYSKRIVMERIEAIRQSRKALGIHSEPAPQSEVEEVKRRLRAFLDGREKRA